MKPLLGIAPIVFLWLSGFNSPQVDCPQALLGTWEYRQKAGEGYDTEGERLVLACVEGAMHGVYFGLEREGEHGLFYTAVETSALTVAAGELAFTVGERQLFRERPASVEQVREKKQTAAGFTRDALHFKGAMHDGALHLTCTSGAGACPEKVMTFRRGKWE